MDVPRKAIALNSTRGRFASAKSKDHAGCSRISAQRPAQFCNGVAISLADIRLKSIPTLHKLKFPTAANREQKSPSGTVPRLPPGKTCSPEYLYF
jgi:hypothetical protein